MPSSTSQSSPLAAMCYNAGSSLDEILLVDEEEFILLSKDIVGNGLLEHARVLKQWRHARMEALVRMEVMEELERNGQDEVISEEEEEEEESVDAVAEWEKEYYENLRKEEESKLSSTTKKEPPLLVLPKEELKTDEELIGEDWHSYLRKQIKAEMQQLKPATKRTTTDGDPPNGVPRVVGASLSDEEESYYDDDTWYSYDDTLAGNTFFNLPAIAEAAVDLIDTGMKAFFDPVPAPAPKIPKCPRAVEEELDPPLRSGAQTTISPRSTEQVETVGTLLDDDGRQAAGTNQPTR
eukprot:CAMPEP_0119015048 /NCGR_PEP_ID=MMETSP1176-20130426/10528_1 /TAXON_ID=265551 /ORGANISM="Synedropsis recta cf, Strain CCMP1620" /LENGTH=293 /DNA_ID=CAMNT_0006968307 /DNA_START=62 /DNA_END=939 /DNA_ORIENTATION=-